MDDKNLTVANGSSLWVLLIGIDCYKTHNDMVVGLSSMRELRGGVYPNLRVEVVAGQHFHYFVIPQGQQAIQSWATQ